MVTEKERYAMADVSLQLQLKPKITQLQTLTIKLLTLHSQDLVEYLQEQVTENPLLDIRYHDISSSGSGAAEKPIDNIRSHEDSLEDMLMKQLRVLTLGKRVLMAAAIVIQSLDDKGFFCGDLDELGMGFQFSLAEMKEGLAVVQSLDPPGIGATSICEALLIQVRRNGNAPWGTEKILESYYDDFLHGRWQNLQKELGITDSAMQGICAYLKKLSLQPARHITQEDEFVRADAEIYIDAEGRPAVRILEELPDVFFRDDLYDLYRQGADSKTKSYIRQARRSFLDLQSALAYRWHSVVTILQELAHWQQVYFTHTGVLQPLTQKKLADLAGLSESTVSRVCRDRYILFERQIYAIQHFFGQPYARGDKADNLTYISDAAIKDRINLLLKGEDSLRPYSDQDLASHLQTEGIHIARRTVTKFRLALGVPNRNIRRRLR
jgi:RNA polymerase sigma-54 factor